MNLPIPLLNTAIGAVQGGLFLLLNHLILRQTFPFTKIAGQLAGYTLVIVIPFTLQFTLSDSHNRRVGLFAASLTLTLIPLALYTGGMLTALERGPILVAFICTLFVGWFVVLPFAQTWVQFGAFRFSYADLFIHSWNNLLTLITVSLVNLMFWGVFILFVSRFERMGVVFPPIQKTVLYPIIGTILGYTFSLGRTHRRALTFLRLICLTLFWSLLPALSALIFIFLIELVWAGLQPLWDTGHATLLLLIPQLLMILLFNTVYQDGTGTPPYTPWVREGIQAALLALPIYTALSGYALSLRIAQYGWSMNRVWAVVIVAIIGLYVFGYAVSALIRTGEWMRVVRPVNIGMAVTLMLLMILINTPLLHPTPITVRSQWGRLMNGTTPPEQFDYDYMGRLGTKGCDMLGLLASLEDHPQRGIIAGGAAAALDKTDCGKK